MTDLDRLRTRAQHAVDLGESWYDDELALDLIAPKSWFDGTWVRDPRETADALYMSAADPRVIVSLIDEVQRLRDLDRGTALGDALLERDRLRAEVEDLREARTKISEYCPSDLEKADKDTLIEELLTQEADRRLLRSQIRDLKADAEHWEKIARSRREHSDAKIAEMQGASILDKAALKKALADVAAIRRALDRLIAGQPPPQHCTEYAMGINHAIGVIDAALAGGRG